MPFCCNSCHFVAVYAVIIILVPIYKGGGGFSKGGEFLVSLPLYESLGQSMKIWFLDINLVCACILRLPVVPLASYMCLIFSVSYLQRPSPKPAASQELEALNAVKKYNEDILKAKERGEDELPPPVPLKKKTSELWRVWLL